MLEGIGANFIDLFLLWPLEGLKWCQFSWLMFGTEKRTRESRVQPFSFVWMGWYLKKQIPLTRDFCGLQPNPWSLKFSHPSDEGKWKLLKRSDVTFLTHQNGIMDEKFLQNILSVNQTKEVHKWGIFSSISLSQTCQSPFSLLSLTLLWDAWDSTMRPKYWQSNSLKWMPSPPCVLFISHVLNLTMREVNLRTWEGMVSTLNKWNHQYAGAGHPRWSSTNHTCLWGPQTGGIQTQIHHDDVFETWKGK